MPSDVWKYTLDLKPLTGCGGERKRGNNKVQERNNSGATAISQLWNASSDTVARTSVLWYQFKPQLSFWE